MKHKTPRPTSTIRKKPPITYPDKDGIHLLCPFCPDKHAIIPGEMSTCGTYIEVNAIQEVFTAQTVRQNKLVCVKCGLGDKEMIRYKNSFVHLVECNPERILLQELPTLNNFAKVVCGLPAPLRNSIETVMGKAEPVNEMDEKGIKTGVVLGYVFLKQGKHGKQKPITT